MKNLKKLIIISVIIFIIIVIVLIIQYRKKRSIELDKINPVTYVEDYIVHRVNNSVDYYTVDTVCGKYLLDLEYGDSEAVYNELDPKYVKESNVTQDNVISKLLYKEYDFEENYRLRLSTNVTDMFYVEGDKGVNLYFVRGYIEDNIKHEKVDFNIIVELDKENKTYYILPQDYVEEKGLENIQENDKYNFDIESIEPNESYNRFDYEIVSDEDIILDYFDKYKNYLLNDKEALYNVLDEEYRNKRFNGYDDFEEYINNNITSLWKAELEKYQAETKDDYVRYFCMDNEGRYYIFYQYYVGSFALMFDDYTVDMPEFVEKYNQADEQGKCILNIDRLFKAINNGDYKFAYSYLSEGFKDRYFGSEEEFANYIKENLFEKNRVEYKSFDEKSDNLFVYNTVIYNADDENEDSDENVQISFIIKLGEKTDFELSFNIE